MGVDIDPAGRHQMALGVDIAPPRTQRAAHGADMGAVDGQIADMAGRAGAVDDGAVANDQVVHDTSPRRFFLSVSDCDPVGQARQAQCISAL